MYVVLVLEIFYRNIKHFFSKEVIKYELRACEHLNNIVFFLTTSLTTFIKEKLNKADGQAKKNNNIYKVTTNIIFNYIVNYLNNETVSIHPTHT